MLEHRRRNQFFTAVMVPTEPLCMAPHAIERYFVCLLTLVSECELIRRHFRGIAECRLLADGFIHIPHTFVSSVSPR